MKKILSILLVFCIALATLAGCSNDIFASNNPKYKIGVIQLVDHPSLNEIYTAFEAQLRFNGYGEDMISIDFQNAQNDMSNINSIAQKFVGDEVDLIVAIATPAAVGAYATAKDTGIPVLFCAVSDPVGAGLLKNMDAPEGNITGTADVVPVDQILDMAMSYTPFETIGFMYNLGEANSVTNINLAKEYCDTHNIGYEEVTVTSTNEVQQAAQSLLDKVDAIFVPNDNTVATAMPVLAEEAIKAGIPVYVGADSMVADGGLATVSVDYTELGTTSADMAMMILSGTPVSEVPAVQITEYTKLLNHSTAQSLGLNPDPFYTGDSGGSPTPEDNGSSGESSDSQSGDSENPQPESEQPAA